MNNHDNGYQYSDVNREIQNFLVSREQRQPKEDTLKEEHGADILSLLESLNKTYTEINTALKMENSAALKDVILKSDVKMSLVCETLLDTLKNTVEERNKLRRETHELERIKREFENKEFNMKLQFDKLKNELEFKKNGLEETNRIVHDQKVKMNDYKQECIKARNETAFYKAKIEELESLRNRTSERMAVYERELEALSAVIKEKDTATQVLLQEKREEENKNMNIKTRISELESIQENMNKKMEIKDKNLSLCNSELAKVLVELKKAKTDADKYKESCEYYEGLYNSLNAQNGYLNSQLNKMLKNTEYNKDIDGFIKKYKRKLRKTKKKVKKLEADNSLLQEKIEESMCTDTSDEYAKQISELNNRNAKYQDEIERLETEKKHLAEQINRMTVDKSLDKYKAQNKPIVQRSYGYKEKPLFSEFKSFPEIVPTHEQNKSTSNRTGAYNKYTSKYPEYRTIENEHKYMHRENLNSDTKLNNKNEADSTYLRLFNLENAYEDKKKEEVVGGFIEDNEIAPEKLNMHYSVTEPEQKHESLDIYRKKQESVNVPVFNKTSANTNGEFSNKPLLSDSIKLANFDRLPVPEKPVRASEKPVEPDNESVESIKTYHTTSSLKEMMARTEQLTKKFTDLETKLEQFKEGETVDKLTDKLKTYNSYYSDWNAESNESDCIL